MLIKYITTFVAPKGIKCTLSPVQHIEDALQEAWKNKDSSLYRTHEQKINNEYYNTIKELITPHAWFNAWNEYKNGNRSPENLVVKALIHKEKISSKEK